MVKMPYYDYDFDFMLDLTPEDTGLFSQYLNNFVFWYETLAYDLGPDLDCVQNLELLYQLILKLQDRHLARIGLL